MRGAWSPSSPAAGPAGAAMITASTSSVRTESEGPGPGHAAGVTGQVRRHAAGFPAGSRSMDSTATPVRMATPRAARAAASSAGRRALPPSSDQKTGAGAGAGGGPAGSRRRRRARIRLPDRRSAASSGGKVGLRTQVVDTAGVDPAHQGVDQALDDLVAQPRSDDVADRPVGGAPGRRGGAGPGRARPGRVRAGPRMPERTMGHARVGTPRFTPSGIIRRRPRTHSDAPLAPGATSASVRPSSSHSRVASRSSGQEGVGGHVDGAPAELGGSDLAPGPAAGLQHHDAGRRAPAARPDELPGRRQPGHAAADRRRHGRAVGRVRRDGRITVGPAAARTTSASRVRKAGSSLSEGVRAKATPRAVGPVAGLDVEVVEDLQVVGDEADRAHHHGGRALRRPPGPSRPAGRARSTGRPCARRSAMPCPRSRSDRRPARAGRRRQRRTRPPGRGRGRPRRRPAGEGCGR